MRKLALSLSASRFMVALVAALSLACVSTKLDYKAAPDLPPQGFHHVLVVADFVDLEDRQAVENAALAALRSEEIAARSGSEFMMRTEGQDEEKQLAALIAEGIDAIFLIGPRGAGSRDVFSPVPPLGIGYTHAVGSKTTATSNRLGGGVSKSTRSWADAQVTLHDPAAGRRVWEATLKGEDLGWGLDTTKVLCKMAEEAVWELVYQGVLQPPN